MATTEIQAKIDELVKERDANLRIMDELSSEFKQRQVRVTEITGALKAIVDIFSVGGESDDTESEADTGSNTNEG